MHILDELAQVMVGYKQANSNPQQSRTASLLAAGEGAICQKVGEEATEVIVAALSEDATMVVEESADLLYHLLVLWTAKGISADQVWQVLAKRRQLSHEQERAYRASQKEHRTP